MPAPVVEVNSEVKVVEESQAQQLMRETLFTYTKAKSRIDKLISDWGTEVSNTSERRKMRKVDVDIEELQNNGTLATDETLIPIRVIDSRIKKEQPDYVAYLTKSRRLVIFTCVDDPTWPTDTLEEAYTRGMTYNGWEIPFYKCLDGAQLHGWDAIEVEYSLSKPLHVGFSHVGHAELVFPKKAKNIEDCELILRKFEISPMKLRELAEDGKFNSEEVEQILTEYVDSKADDFIEIYKGFFKFKKTVYVFWYCSKATSNWLKEPQPLFLGRRRQNVSQTISMVVDPATGIPMPQQTPAVTWENVYESSYPIKIQLYNEDEEPAITDRKGRAFSDEPEQEAQTAVWTCTVNGAVRASNVFASPKNIGASGGTLKQLDTKLQHGCIYSEPLDFWHTDFPDPILLEIVNKLDLQKQNETGQVAYAVQNRQDSRKTATEVSSAEKKQSLLSSIQVTLYSTFLREVHSYAWPIVQSLALQGEVVLLPTSAPKDLLTKTYSVRPAGDDDVVKRAERLQAFIGMWGSISQTKAAPAFLVDMLKAALPLDADKYIPTILQGIQDNSVSMALVEVLKALIEDPQVAPAIQQYIPKIQQLIQNVTQPTSSGPTQQQY